MVSKLKYDSELIIYLTKNNKTWVHKNGFTYLIKSSERLYDSETKSSKGGFTPKIFSELPGKVLKVFVKEGDVLEANTSMLSIEAMKMEHSFKSSAKCRVLKLHIKEGQSISPNMILIELEPEPEETENKEEI